MTDTPQAVEEAYNFQMSRELTKDDFAACAVLAEALLDGAPEAFEAMDVSIVEYLYALCWNIKQGISARSTSYHDDTLRQD